MSQPGDVETRKLVVSNPSRGRINSAGRISMRVKERKMSRMKTRLVQFHGLKCDALK